MASAAAVPISPLSAAQAPSAIPAGARSRSPRRADPQQRTGPVSYAATSPRDWVLQKSPTHGSYHNVFIGASRRAPAVFAFFKDLEWSRVPFEPKKEERRPFTINIDVESEDQLAFLREVDAWAKDQIATHSEELLGVTRSVAEIDSMAIYRKPWYEPPDGKYSPRIDARVLFTGPQALLTEIAVVDGDGGGQGQEEIHKGVGEEHFRAVTARLVQWRDHPVRAVLRVDSFHVFDDRSGQRKVALQLAVKDLTVKIASRKSSGETDSRVQTLPCGGLAPLLVRRTSQLDVGESSTPGAPASAPLSTALPGAAPEAAPTSQDGRLAGAGK